MRIMRLHSSPITSISLFNAVCWATFLSWSWRKCCGFTDGIMAWWQILVKDLFYMHLHRNLTWKCYFFHFLFCLLSDSFGSWWRPITGIGGLYLLYWAFHPEVCSALMDVPYEICPMWVWIGICVPVCVHTIVCLCECVFMCVGCLKWSAELV